MPKFIVVVLAAAVNVSNNRSRRRQIFVSGGQLPAKLRIRLSTNYPSSFDLLTTSS